ncbi:unnamed protein product, partial [Mesorhabditis belari]|uniref:Uncharacterized protein n=1 Tax=Mesorhabditis belari TaxID=2138241 RepID=A0AAF3FLS1_9BILA
MAIIESRFPRAAHIPSFLVSSGVPCVAVSFILHIFHQSHQSLPRVCFSSLHFPCVSSLSLLRHPFISA